jgi:PIN domain nuclease of toxin-antitoxin system
VSNKVVLDASAVMAALQNEPGSERVISELGKAAISAVNFAEVLSKLSRTGGDLNRILPDIHHLIHEILPFDTDQALAVGDLEPPTRGKGLSLGDRACLALGKSLNAPVLTADRAWANLDIGIQIELIRNSAS